MYKLFKCSVVTDRYNYGFDIVDESRTKAESKSLNYVRRNYKNEELIGGGSKEMKGVFDKKSIKLVERNENETPYY